MDGKGKLSQVARVLRFRFSPAEIMEAAKTFIGIYRICSMKYVGAELFIALVIYSLNAWSINRLPRPPMSLGAKPKTWFHTSVDSMQK